MFMKNQILNLIEFYKKVEKLKLTTRHSWLTDKSRQESVAEHSWMLCFLAILLSDKIESKVDLLKVLKILVVHDLAESVTGDIPSHEVSKRQENNKDHYFDYDKFMRNFKDIIDNQTMEKIILAKAENRIDKKFLEKYKKNNNF